IQIGHSGILDAISDEHAAIAERHGVRSSVAIPILDAQDHPMMVVLLHGAYPGQFSTAPMRMWLESVQHLITPVFQRLERGLATKTPLDTFTRQRLRALLFDDQLQIMVQPIVTLRTGAVDKVEVLARLRDGDQLVSPATFLPAFGQQDLQVLFRKGLRQILEWLGTWDAQGVCVDASINLPPSVLVSPDCPRWIEEELQTHQLAPSRLFLELLETEDDAQDVARRDAAVAQLATLGVRLVMDDLGSGYSSLQRLRTLPFHAVKIDQELVKHAAQDSHQTVPFIGSLVGMAQTLGLAVVIEGLETNDLVEMASGLGAEYGQGYALARPFLPEKFEDWAKQSRAFSWMTERSTELGKLAFSFLE
ncbi:MAG: EAL domain-containing protein, partial [Thiomonas sp.]